MIIHDACRRTTAELGTPGTITVIGVRSSPFVRKVIFTLETKRIPYAFHMLAAYDRKQRAILMKLNPRGLMPVVIDGQQRVRIESADICEWLDEAFPQGYKSTEAQEAIRKDQADDMRVRGTKCTPDERRRRAGRVYPIDDDMRAWAKRVEMWAGNEFRPVFGANFFFQLVVKPVFWKKQPNPARVKRARTVDIPRLLATLECVTCGLPTPFVGGDFVCVVDVTIVGWLHNAALVGHDIDAFMYPSAAAYMKRVERNPVWQRMMRAEGGDDDIAQYCAKLRLAGRAKL